MEKAGLPIQEENSDYTSSYWPPRHLRMPPACSQADDTRAGPAATFPCSVFQSLPLLPRCNQTWVSPPGNQPNIPPNLSPLNSHRQCRFQGLSTGHVVIRSINPLKEQNYVKQSEKTKAKLPKRDILNESHIIYYNFNY